MIGSDKRCCHVSIYPPETWWDEGDEIGARIAISIHLLGRTRAASRAGRAGRAGNMLRVSDRYRSPLPRYPFND